ncbi:hypothetical protein KC19_VG046300 [Ceratodon purpureus]|uniref:Uncharacterized protein n=1 Tax=Ceratodon purpureus TaxID=3225 RepID=A0A8T0HMG3_CERPU|nr:hypothetical protein KC19_VG046300 [Ceratodon purpureus]
MYHSWTLSRTCPCVPKFAMLLWSPSLPTFLFVDDYIWKCVAVASRCTRQISVVVEIFVHEEPPRRSLMRVSWNVVAVDGHCCQYIHITPYSKPSIAKTAADNLYSPVIRKTPLLLRISSIEEPEPNKSGGVT